jgi:uncharacterized protein YutD
MNSKESQTKNFQTGQNTNNSATMDLENLQKKYSNLLAKYKSAVNEYTNFLSDQANNPDKKQTFTGLNGYAVIGSERIGFRDVPSLQECEASCAKLSNCTGATFITPKGNNRGCILSGGDPKVVRAFPDTYAIVTKGKQLLLNMESINEELIATNKEIVNKIKNIEPIIHNNANERSIKNKELVNNYKDLMEERDEISNLLKDYDTLDGVEKENQIKITKNYYSYFLLLILVIVFIFLLYSISLPYYSQSYSQPSYGYGTPYGSSGSNAYLIVVLLLFLTITLYFFQNIFGKYIDITEWKNWFYSIW